MANFDYEHILFRHELKGAFNIPLLVIGVGLLGYSLGKTTPDAIISISANRIHAPKYPTASELKAY